MRLSRADLGADPIAALRGWVAEARDGGHGDDFVVTLATVDPTGAPDARLVVIRTLDATGLTFYNDTRSPKGRQLAHEDRAALVAHWPGLARQVRVRGRVEIEPPAESDAAYATRDRRSHIGYWTSEQSEPVADRAALERRQDDVVARFEGRDLPRPEHWVVYRLRPRVVEFWQAGERHLHDRIVFTWSDRWRAERLQP